MPFLIASPLVEIVSVVFNKGLHGDRIKFYLSRLKKILKIGVGGAINGIRMRQWYNQGMLDFVTIEDVSSICKKNNIPYFEVNNINSPQTIEIFRNAKADLGVSLGNGYISKKIFSIPAQGMINIHHELLPEYQNAQSVIWQLYNGSDKTGYTIHRINAKIDAGDILYQEVVPIQIKKSLGKTVSATCALLLKSSARGLVYVLENFRDMEERSIPQQEGTKYTTPTLKQYLQITNNFKRIRNDKGELDR